MARNHFGNLTSMYSNTNFKQVINIWFAYATQLYVNFFKTFSTIKKIQFWQCLVSKLWFKASNHPKTSHSQHGSSTWESCECFPFTPMEYVWTFLHSLQFPCSFWSQEKLMMFPSSCKWHFVVHFESWSHSQIKIESNVGWLFNLAN